MASIGSTPAPIFHHCVYHGRKCTKNYWCHLWAWALKLSVCRLQMASLKGLRTTTYVRVSWALLFAIPGLTYVRAFTFQVLNALGTFLFFLCIFFFSFLFIVLIIAVMFGVVRVLWHKYTLLIFFLHFCALF